MQLHSRSPLLIAIIVSLAACGRSDVREASGQVAAIVNGEEISVHRVNSSAITRSNDILPGEPEQSAARALRNVIDQELLVQQAFDAKLDRDPQVMQAIEGARRQILARAYIDRAVSGRPTESREEISAFYKEHPALFERRRIYSFHELVLDAAPDDLKALKAAAAAAKSLDEVAGWLKARKLPFRPVTTRKLAEQIPMEVLPQVFAMRDGQIAVLSTSRGTSVLQLVQSEAAPLRAQEATPAIERFLASRKRLELARAEVKRLRDQAKIEYLGEFAPAHSGEPAPAGAKPAGEHVGHIERGLAGLK